MFSIVFLIISIHSCNCSSLIIRGGAKRIMSLCVGFANSPWSLRARQTFQAFVPKDLEITRLHYKAF